jgi:predicted permease
VSLSLLLLIGAGLFARSLRNLESIDTGFLRQSVLRFKLNTDSSGYQEDPRLVSLYQKIEQRLESMAGVKAASFSFFSFNEGNWTAGISLPGANQLSERDRQVHGNVVGPRFFETMGLPMLIGRRFGPQDTASSPKVAVINEAWVHHFWPHDYPLGKRFGLDGDQQKPDVEVIGVVKNAKYQSVRENVPPMMYLPFTQRAQYLNDLEVNVTGDPLVMIPRIRQALAEVEPNLPVSDVATMAAVVDQSLARELLIAKLSGFFGLLALALACVGLYGTMSYAVARRTNEIGIRMALGAPRGLVLRQVLRESLLLVAIGAACGIPVAFAAQRLIAGLLFGLKTADPFTFVSATAALALVALLAAYVPARRASRVDPMVALRHE